MPLKQVTKSSDNSLTTFKVRKQTLNAGYGMKIQKISIQYLFFLNPPHFDDHHIHP